MCLEYHCHTVNQAEGASISEERKEMLNLTTHSTHWIYGYMVKNHSDNERGNLLVPLHGLLFLISSKVSVICTIPHIR